MASSRQRWQKHCGQRSAKTCLILALGVSSFLQPFCVLGGETDVIGNLQQLEILANKDPQRAQAALEATRKGLDRSSQPEAWLYATSIAAEMYVRFKKEELDAYRVEAERLESKDLQLRFLMLQMEFAETNAEAMAAYDQGETICAGWDDPLACGKMHLHAAWYHYRVNNVAAGMKQAEAALERFRSLTGIYRFHYYDAQSTFESLLSTNGQLDRAIKLAEENLRWFQAEGYLNLASLEANNLAIYFIKIDPKNTAQITKYLDRSEQIALKLNDPQAAARALYARGKYLFEQGKFAEAITALDKALPLYVQTTKMDHAALTRIIKAKCLLGLADIVRAKAAIEEAQTMITPDFKYEAMQVLSVRHDIAKREGNLANAHRYLEEYFAAWKAQKQEEEQQELARLSTQLGLQVEEQKNKDLKHENEIQSRKLREAERFKIFLIVLSVLTLSTVRLLFLARKQSQSLRVSQMKMKRILDNIDEGLLTIDRSRKISDDYSKRLPEILGHRDEIAGEDFIEALFARSQLAGEEVSIIREVLDASLGEDKIAWEMNLENLPVECILDDGAAKVVAIRWTPLFGPDQTLQRLLVTLTDVTQERALEKTVGTQRKHWQALPETLRELLQARPDRIEKALLDTESVLNKVEALGSQIEVIRELHTQKGVARTLGLKALSQDLHELETLLQPRTGQQALGKMVLDQIQDARSRIGEYRSLTAVLHQASNHPADDHPWLASSVSAHLGVWLRQMQAAGLPLHAVQVRDEVLEWAPDDMAIFEELCLHAINNSLEHGFIFPAQRGELLHEPSLDILARFQHQSIIVDIRDNGAGINMEKLTELAAARRFTPAPGESVADVVFCDGVSTADRLTLSSGRGVGLSAAKAGIEKRGGKIRIMPNDKTRGTWIRAFWPASARRSEASARGA